MKCWESRRISSGAPPPPGVDYALTEVVHCKSASRQGLERRRGRPGALELCPALYLRRIVQAAGARLVVAVGSDAIRQLARELALPADFGLMARGKCPLVPLAPGGDLKQCLAIGGISSADRRNVLDDRVLSPRDRNRVRALLA